MINNDSISKLDDAMRQLVEAILKVSESNYPQKPQGDSVKIQSPNSFNNSREKPQQESKCCN